MGKMHEEVLNNLKKLSAIIAAVTAISGIFTAVTGFNPAWAVLITGGSGLVLFLVSAMCDRVIEKVNKRIDSVETDLKKETDAIRAENHQQDLSLKRLELMNLIRNCPENKVEIEKVARHYFTVLKGDWYASQIYSEWASKYGGDISFVIAE